MEMTTDLVKDRSPEELPERRFVISLSQLSRKAVTYFWVDTKREIMVVPTSESFSVFASICPHMGARLEAGTNFKKISCPWHGLQFETTSCRSNHSRFTRIKQYRATIENNELIIWV